MNRSPFVRDLHELGYDVDLVGGYFALYGLPYLDRDRTLRHGDLFSPINLGADGAIDGTCTHQAWWRGGRPHGRDGAELRIGIAVAAVQIVPDVITDLAFSLKLRDANQQPRDYLTFQEKIETYLHVIVEPAVREHPDATPLRAIYRKVVEQASPLRLPDTASANYGINDIADRLRGKRVAIVGLGGTGGFILDFIARTHLEEIALFDSDKVHVHTLFRIPGFIGRSAIGKPKVDALANHYSGWHSGITPVPERVNADNIERLRNFDFVFVSVDDGPSRRFLIDWLSCSCIPYVDCGMGLVRSFGGTLNGMTRITGVDRTAYERNVDTLYLPTINAKDAEYRKQAQIIELNALNAAMAVVRFKQHFELYERADLATAYIFETASFEVSAEGKNR